MGKKSGKSGSRESPEVWKRKTLKLQVFDRGCHFDQREKSYFNQKSRTTLKKISPCGRNDSAPIGLAVCHASFMPVNLVRLCSFDSKRETFFQQEKVFCFEEDFSYRRNDSHVGLFRLSDFQTFRLFSN
ncbi:MAG: hypothetical protein V5804_10550 [Mucilaginibacter sp.]|uniref:hypothetical protein n=1 Tax=Mucilaginibacter sp. TaxID=1882438 RepID=UPI0034E5309B